ncbi:MAG: Ribophorin I-domain-containing protein [Monoraphidium minutum]|nr:MAG: Ribophorin I-domain-containing protein [Monoraphidium minutum]
MARLRVTAGDAKPATAPAPPPAGAPAGARCWSAEAEVPAGGEVTLEAAASFTGVMPPNPSQLAQNEALKVEYNDTLWALSPYAIKQQTTQAVLPNEFVVSMGPSSQCDLAGPKVECKDLGPAKPWAEELIKLHFTHSKHFKKVLTLVREVEVSHWGNIYVEESYVIQNAGAEHKGQFSRLRHTYNREYRETSFQDLRAKLPPSARHLYYKDLIGNVSSSRTRQGAKETVVDLSLRYPLMGGWKADFVLGYSLPLAGFLFRRPKGRTRLIVDVSSPIEDVTIEELETRIVLPEGSTNIKYTLPYEMEASWDKKYTYLDTAGRPVLVLRKSNLIALHNKAVAVDYTFTTAALLHEPMLLIMVFAALFAAYAAYNRLELTITRDDAWLEGQAREKAADTLTKLAAAYDAESAEIGRVLSAVDRLTDADSAEAAAELRTAAEAKLRTLEAQAKALVDTLEGVLPKAAAAAREHAERGKALQQRAAKLMAEKAEHLRKGTPAAEAARRVAPGLRSLEDARAEWAAAGAALC